MCYRFLKRLWKIPQLKSPLLFKLCRQFTIAPFQSTVQRKRVNGLRNAWFSVYVAALEREVKLQIERKVFIKYYTNVFCLNISGCVECQDCEKLQHKSCLGWRKQLGPYKCPQCWEKADLIKSRATLIVAPAALRKQWCREMKTHLKPG